MFLASFFSATTTFPFHAQSLSESLLILFFSNAPCFLLFCFRLFYAYDLVEDDVGEETIDQTSTAEQSRLWTNVPGRWYQCKATDPVAGINVDD